MKPSTFNNKYGDNAYQDRYNKMVIKLQQQVLTILKKLYQMNNGLNPGMIFIMNKE